jgi:hypothetical protein
MKEKKIIFTLAIIIIFIIILSFFLKKETDKITNYNFDSALIINVQDVVDTLDKSLIVLSSELAENLILKTDSPVILIDNIQINKTDIEKLLREKKDTISFNNFKIYKQSKDKKDKKIKLKFKLKPEDGRDSSYVNIKLYAGQFPLNKIIKSDRSKYFVVETEHYNSRNRSIDKIEIPLSLVNSATNIADIFIDNANKEELKLFKNLLNSPKPLMFIDNFKDSTKVFMYIK